MTAVLDHAEVALRPPQAVAVAGELNGSWQSESTNLGAASDRIMESLQRLEAYATQHALPAYVNVARSALAETRELLETPGKAHILDKFGVVRPDERVRFAVDQAVPGAVERAELGAKVLPPVAEAWRPKESRLVKVGRAVTKFFAKGKELGQALFSEDRTPSASVEVRHEARHARRNAVSWWAGAAAVDPFGFGTAGSGRLM